MDALETQKYIRKNGLEALSNLGIRIVHHPNLPLVCLKYSQINSPKTYTVVRECRGLVLEKETWKVVAKPFNRFFNVGELSEEFEQFDWNNFETTEKVDGSLIILYHYNDDWHANTSGSFGLNTLPNTNITWRDLFWSTTTLNKSKLVPSFTYCFELCTPYNVVVKHYQEPTTFLLGVIDTGIYRGRQLNSEFYECAVDETAKRLGCKRPKRWKCSSKESVTRLMTSLERDNETHEGVVIVDSTGLRFKWKTEDYLTKHRLADSLCPKNLTSIVLRGEQSEILAYRPDVKGALTEVAQAIGVLVDDIIVLWNSTRSLSAQKDFALAVKDHKYSWVLFRLRKDGELDSPRQAIINILAERPEKLARELFNGKVFNYDHTR